MLLIVFDPLARQRPKFVTEVNLTPFHPRDFITPLASENQHLHHCAKRPADLLRSEPHRPQLLVIQHAVARALIGWWLYAGTRGGSDNVARHQPVEQFASSGKTRLAAMGAPASTTRSSTSSTSRRVMLLTARPRQRGITCNRSSRSVSCAVRGQFLRLQWRSMNCATARSIVSALAARACAFSCPGSRPSAAARSAFPAKARAAFRSMAGWLPRVNLRVVPLWR